MKADLAVAMGGRVAEEMIFGSDMVTSGASSDIKMATTLARAMVTQYGMSKNLGPLSYGENQEEVFLGHSISRTQNHSDDTQRKVDQEVRDLVEEGLATARKILKKEIDNLHAIAQALLEYETLSGEEIINLLKGKKPHRESPDDSKPESGSAVPVAGGKSKAKSKSRKPGGMKPQTEF